MCVYITNVKITREKKMKRRRKFEREEKRRFKKGRCSQFSFFQEDKKKTKPKKRGERKFRF